jgi:hypothetical protein
MAPSLTRSSTRTTGGHAIKAAFWALETSFAERPALTWIVYNAALRQLVIAAADH